jgi:hypothetical protein
VFSGERAQARRKELLGEGAPHPVGSQANDLVRERLVKTLEREGYAPAIEDRWACGPYGTCARTRNLIATAPGTAAGPPVILAAHYDSVAAGPGASDDGAGVAAALEIARSLRHGPPLAKSVRFVITDGEEAGLLGAFAYMSSRDETAAAIVNLDSRGTQGLATLFETGPNSSAVIDFVASELPRPKTSSLFNTVYELLPNDTDFTVLRRGGASGANLAFFEGASRYHTPLDDLAHGSVGSLQHEGDTALALVRAFAKGDLATRSSERLVWFDLGSRWVIRWPARFSAPLVAAGLLLVATAMARARQRWNWRRLAWSFAAAVGAPIGSVLAATALGALLFVTGRAPAPWIAHPWPAFAAALATAVGITLAIAGRIRDRWATFCSAWSLWGAIGLASSVALPGGSYLFVPPLVAAGAAGLAGSHTRHVQGWMLAPFAIVAIEWASLFLLTPEALGMLALPVYGLLAALCALTVVPLLPTRPRARRTMTLAALATGLALTTTSLAMPPFSRDSPQRLNVLYLKDDRAGARWLLDSWWAGFRYGLPPRAMLDVAKFAPEPVVALPFLSDTMRAAPAADAGLLAPELTIVARDEKPSTRSVRIRVRSQRSAPDFIVAFGPAVPLVGARLAETRMPPQHPFVRKYLFRGWKPIMLIGVPIDGIEVELEFGSKDPVEAVLVDRTRGLPPEGQAIERTRPEWSQPTQDGDATLVLTHVSL